LKRVGHQLLKAHILYAGHALRAVEIFSSGVAVFVTLPGVVHQKFRNFSERAAFLSKVNDETGAAFLRRFDGLFNSMNQIWPAGADVGSENVGAVALVVYTACERFTGVRDVLYFAENVSRGVSNRR